MPHFGSVRFAELIFVCRWVGLEKLGGPRGGVTGNARVCSGTLGNFREL